MYVNYIYNFKSECIICTLVVDPIVSAILMLDAIIFCCAPIDCIFDPAVYVLVFCFRN